MIAIASKHKALFSGLVVMLFAACSSDNDHFCAKYSYYYDELTQPGIMPYRDIRQQLRKELADPDRDPDKTRIALFVLNDIEGEVKPAGLSAQDYCLQNQLWLRYSPSRR